MNQREGWWKWEIRWLSGATVVVCRRGKVRQADVGRMRKGIGTSLRARFVQTLPRRVE